MHRRRRPIQYSELHLPQRSPSLNFQTAPPIGPEVPSGIQGPPSRGPQAIIITSPPLSWTAERASELYPSFALAQLNIQPFPSPAWHLSSYAERLVPFETHVLSLTSPSSTFGLLLGKLVTVRIIRRSFFFYAFPCTRPSPLKQQHSYVAFAGGTLTPGLALLGSYILAGASILESMTQPFQIQLSTQVVIV